MKLAAVVTILVLHGGGFNGGDPIKVAPIAEDLRSAGYRTIVVPYREENPTGNILGEIETVQRYTENARLRGPVVAYGISSGGTLAGALAARGEVDGAVVGGGPMNLLTWLSLDLYFSSARYWADLGMSPDDRRRASPYHRLDGRQTPQLMIFGALDVLVPVEQGINYNRAAAAGQRDTTLTIMPLTGHEYPQQYRDQAQAWIQQRWPVTP